MIIFDCNMKSHSDMEFADKNWIPHSAASLTVMVRL